MKENFISKIFNKKNRKNNDVSFYKNETLYFLHIAKTAGTSLINILDQYYEADEISPVTLSHQITEMGPDALLNYKLIRGHLGCAPINIFNQYNKKINIVTFLRDTVLRSISHYNHLLRHKDHWLYNHLPSGNLTLAEFLQFPPARKLITNFQTRNLALYFELLNKVFYDENGNKLSNNMGNLLTFAKLPKIYNHSDYLLDNAKKTLDKARFVGITEYFSESVNVMMQEIFPFQKNTDYFENIAPSDMLSKMDVTDKEINEIRDLNNLDIEIYEYAKEIFKKMKKSTKYS